MTLESIITTNIMEALGDPTYAGILLFAFFVGALLVVPTKFDVKIAILFPVSLLAIAFIPWFAVIIVLVGGFLISKALSRGTAS